MKRVFRSIILLLGAIVVAQCQTLASTASDKGSVTGSHNVSFSSVFSNNLTNSLAQAATVSFSTTYYFPHFALGGGWQTVLTYVNYSPQPVTCQTNFISDGGTPLAVPFADTGSSAVRTDVLAAGGELHQQSQVDPSGPQVNGWAIGQCTGPVKGSLLFRLFSGGTAVGEAGVNATTASTAQFVTYAQTLTGVAYANPSTDTGANVTIRALNSAGVTQGTTTFPLGPQQHGAANIGPLLGINFTGSVQITSDQPIVSLSINAEAFPAFSSLPPGDLDGSIALADGSGKGSGNAASPTTYYLPHFAIAGGWQTVLTYVNFSGQTVSCTTNFFGDDGSALKVDFGGGAASTRTDILAPGGEIHQQSQANTSGTAITGWAQGQCTGPVKASLLFRLFSNGTAIGEAGVNASTAPTTEFVTYATNQAGVAYANPPANAAATVTVTALDTTGAFMGVTSFQLAPGQHGSQNVGPMLGLGSFNGSVQVTSTQPIVSLSLNAEAFPAFSSLPPGDLSPGTVLAAGH